MSTRKSLAWSFSQQFGQKGLQFLASIVIARLLTPDEVGVFAIAMAAQALISSLREFGVGSYLIREEELNDDKIRTAFGIWLAVSWSLGLFVLLVRGPLATLYDTPGIADVMILLSISFFITPFGQPANALLTREMRFDVLHHIALTTTVASIATSITLAALGFSYMALAWGMVAGVVVRALLLIAVRPDHLKLLPGFRYWRDVVQFGGYLTGASLAGTVNTEGVKFVLGGLITPGTLALFERAVQIPSLARQSLFGPLGRVLFPTFSKDIREGHSIGPAVVKLVAAQTVIIWPTFLTIGLLAEPVVVFLFGENWRVAGEILPYILFAQALLPLLPQLEQILVPYGEVRRLFWLRMVLMVSNIGLAVAGAIHSLELFAMLRPVETSIAVTLIYLAIRHLWQVEPGQIHPIYARAVMVSLISAVPAAVVRVIWADAVPIWALLVVAASAPVLWLLGIYLTNHPLRKEIGDAVNYGLSSVSLRKNG